MPNDNPQPATEPSEFAMKIARQINTRKTVKGEKPCDCLRCQRADIAVARIIDDALRVVVAQAERGEKYETIVSAVADKLGCGYDNILDRLNRVCSRSVSVERAAHELRSSAGDLLRSASRLDMATPAAPVESDATSKSLDAKMAMEGK